MDVTKNNTQIAVFRLESFSQPFFWAPFFGDQMMRSANEETLRNLFVGGFKKGHFLSLAEGVYQVNPMNQWKVLVKDLLSFVFRVICPRLVLRTYFWKLVIFICMLSLSTKRDFLHLNEKMALCSGLGCFLLTEWFEQNNRDWLIQKHVVIFLVWLSPERWESLSLFDSSKWHDGFSEVNVTIRGSTPPEN